MALQTFSFSQVVANFATAAQGAASALLDFTIGSPLLAVGEALAGVVLWLQAIVLQLLTLTRAATSQGSDLDSWMADFGVTRLPASAASGTVTFARFTASQQAQVAPGVTVQTADGTQTFAVATDTTNTAWNAGLGAYVLLAGTTSITVPVQALNPGTQGNVQAGTVTAITTPIPAVDTVTNAAAFLNGIDPESDTALRARFQLFLASLSKGTKIAIEYAIRSTQQGLSDQIAQNQDYNGAYDNGYATIIVDDGSGYPSANLLSLVYAAVDPVKPLGGRFGIFPPAVLSANVSMVLTTAPGFVHTAVTNAVVVAVQNFINGLPLAASLPWSQLAAVAYGVPGVANVTGVLLNGAAADLTATYQNKLLAGSIVVS